MYNEQEGIVRQEAVNTMSKIYEKRKIPLEYEDKLYSIFIYLIVNDLHWEVSLNALNFWKLDIMRRCSDQGMIDGTFPTVTFSKEHKKIVQLTPREINVRLTKIFNELSARGCIAVMYKCITEDMDLSVTAKVLKTLQCMHSMIQKYEFEPLPELLILSQQDEQKANQANTTTSSTTDLLMNNCEMPETTNNSNMSKNEKNSDEVIDEMLKDKDLNYIVKICEEKLKLNGNIPVNSIDPMLYKQYAYKNTKELLNLLKTQDITEILEKRKKLLNCSENFESLVDEIWHIFNLSEADSFITTDCY